MAQMVNIVHPNQVPGAPAARVPLPAFQQVWEPQGWTLAEDNPSPATETAVEADDEELPLWEEDDIQEDD